MKLKKRLSMVLVFAVLMSTLGLCSPAYAMDNTGGESAGQISLLAFDFAPRGWVLCDGSTLNISQYPVLFETIGNTFGGDDSTTFKVPDLRNASPVSGAKYYMSIKDNYGFNSGELTIGEVCLLPDILVQKTDTLGYPFLKCNGSTYSTTTYKAFYDIIGTTFGGNGVTTFGVPDLTKASPLEGLSYYIVCNGLYPQTGEKIPAPEFIASIDLFPFTDRTFSNAAVCNGQILSTANNQALYSLVLTTYGGSNLNFAIPDLRGAVPSPSFQYYLNTGGIYPSRS